MRYESHGEKRAFGVDISVPGCDIIRCKELDISGAKASFKDINIKVLADSELQDIEGGGFRVLVSKNSQY